MTRPVELANAMRKARRALEAARVLLDKSDLEGACNRAYYAMFHAAHAALWASGAQQPGAVVKSHSGLISAFGQQLVKTGVIDAEHGRAFGRVQKTRMLADYTVDPPTETDAITALAQAEAFVGAIKSKFEIE